jgi:hypothetical protein
VNPYCPGHDPLLRAGAIICPRCGRRGWPTAAAWCGDLVLATYTPGCDHVAAGTWLVDPNQLTTDTRWCGELTATTGAPCRNRARPDLAGRCHQHSRRDVR